MDSIKKNHLLSDIYEKDDIFEKYQNEILRKLFTYKDEIEKLQEAINFKQKELDNFIEEYKITNRIIKL